MRYLRALAAMVGLVLVWAVVAAQIPTTSVVTEAGPPPSSLSAAADATPVVSLAVEKVPPCKYPCEKPKPTTPPPTTTPPPPTSLPYNVECGTYFVEVFGSAAAPGNHVYSFAGRADTDDCREILDPVDCASSGGAIVLNGLPFELDQLPLDLAVAPEDAFPGWVQLNVHCPSGSHHVRWIVEEATTPK